MEFILEFVFEIFWEVLIEGVFIGAAEYFGVYYARRRDQETPASKDEFRKRRLLKYLFLGILVGVIMGYATSPPSELTSLYLLSSHCLCRALLVFLPLTAAKSLLPSPNSRQSRDLQPGSYFRSRRVSPN